MYGRVEHGEECSWGGRRTRGVEMAPISDAFCSELIKLGLGWVPFWVESHQEYSGVSHSTPLICYISFIGIPLICYISFIGIQNAPPRLLMNPALKPVYRHFARNHVEQCAKFVS